MSGPVLGCGGRAPSARPHPFAPSCPRILKKLIKATFQMPSPSSGQRRPGFITSATEPAAYTSIAGISQRPATQPASKMNSFVRRQHSQRPATQSASKMNVFLAGTQPAAQRAGGTHASLQKERPRPIGRPSSGRRRRASPSAWPRTRPSSSRSSSTSPRS